MSFEEILSSEKVYKERMDRLLDEFLKEKKLLSKHLRDIESDRKVTFGQKVADKVADFGGSWSFIISFMLALVGWIVLNSIGILTKPLDPYPYILLNLILSCIAALQAPIIMMSQNRQEEKDRRRERSDFMVNLKAEMEIRNMHEKMDLLLNDQMTSMFEIQRQQLELLTQIIEDRGKEIKKASPPERSL